MISTRIFGRRARFLASATGVLALLGGCAALSGDRRADREAHIIGELQKSNLLQDRLTAIELQSGGRLGFAMINQDGSLVSSYRGSERFAMCSTFKTVLAADILERADRKRILLTRRVAYGPADLLDYAPAARRHYDSARARGVMTIGQLAEAAVVESDNSAANLLLARIGGPQDVTRFARAFGDRMTRLDRIEPALNENGLGDFRDTTTPDAMAGLTHKIIVANVLRPASRTLLTNWLVASPTGKDRIRAGLPTGWRAGSKTGSCGTAYNDVAVAWDDRGRPMVLAVFLDRPTKTGDEANKIIADVARLVTGPQ